MLLRVDAVEGVLGEHYPVWVPIIRPVAWALLAVGVAGIAMPLWPRIPVALSPKIKLRCMAEDVDALAESLSKYQNHDCGTQVGHEPPLLLEIKIAALKGKLESVGVRSPPTSDLKAWRDYLPYLRGWVAAGDLRTARWYQPGRTAIAGWR